MIFWPIIVGIVLTTLLAVSLSLFIGKRFLKISDLNFGKLTLALVVSLGIGSFSVYYVQVLAIFGLFGFGLFYIFIGIPFIIIFHYILKKLLIEIHFRQSLVLFFSALLVVMIVFMTVFIPFWNSMFI